MGLCDAWLDESGSHRALDPGVYILSAVMCEDQHLETTERKFPETLAGAEVSDIDLDTEEFVFGGERLIEQRAQEIAERV